MQDYKYYHYIYNKLVLKHKEWNLQREVCDETIELPSELVEIINCIEVRYGISLYKNARKNIEKFNIWRREYNDHINEEYIQTATYFVLYCCLVDKILDSEKYSLEQKYMVYKDLENFLEMSDMITYNLYELYQLRKRVQDFIKTKLMSKVNNCVLIKEKIKRAIKSEQFMTFHSVSDFDMNLEQNLVLDKSVEFVSAAFLIAVYDQINNYVIEISETIGKIFGYIDDICDYPADMETGSLNSLLFIWAERDKKSEIESRMKWTTEDIEFAINILEEEIGKLKKMVGKEMYLFVLNELWDWTIEVRKNTEN